MSVEGYKITTSVQEILNHFLMILSNKVDIDGGKAADLSLVTLQPGASS